MILRNVGNTVGFEESTKRVGRTGGSGYLPAPGLCLQRLAMPAFFCVVKIPGQP